MSEHFSKAQEKSQAGFLNKFRHRLLEITSKDIFQKGWNGAIHYFTPRLFQARSTARIALEEYEKTGKLSPNTIAALRAIADDLADYEMNTTDCFDEMESALRSIRGIFANEESDRAKGILRLCDNGLWRIENGKYKSR